MQTITPIDIPSLTSALKAKCVLSITSKLSCRPTDPLLAFLEFLPGLSFEKIVDRCWLNIFILGTHQSFEDAVRFAIEKDEKAAGEPNAEIQQSIREEMKLCIHHFAEEARWVLSANTLINLGVTPQETWEKVESQ